MGGLLRDAPVWVAVLGSPGVGKTALCNRWIDGEFAAEETVVVEVKRKAVVCGGRSVEVGLLDVSGIGNYRVWLSAAQAIVVVYDVACEASFRAAQGLCSTAAGYKCAAALAGNKIDLVADENHPICVEAKSLAKRFGIVHRAVSALRGWGVDELFEEVIGRAVMGPTGGVVARDAAPSLFAIPRTVCVEREENSCCGCCRGRYVRIPDRRSG